MDNPYQSPAAKSPLDPRPTKWSIRMAVIAIGFMIFVESVIVSTRNVFSQIFEDFDWEPSLVTQFAVSPFLPLVVAIVILAAIGKEFVPTLRPASDKFNLVVLLTGVGFLAIYLAGVLVPLVSLIRSLSSSP